MMNEVKPIFHIPIPENRTFNPDLGTMEFNIAARVANMMDTAIIQACLDSAKNAGLTDLYLIDEDFVLNAMKKQIPVDPDSSVCQWHVSHYCPICGNQLKAPGVEQFKSGSYCDRCGQKIKWGDCSD